MQEQPQPDANRRRVGRRVAVSARPLAASLLRAQSRTPASATVSRRKRRTTSLRGGRGIVRIWETGLTKGNLIMEGSLDGTGQLVLEGRTDQYHGRVRLRREKPGVR